MSAEQQVDDTIYAEVYVESREQQRITRAVQDIIEHRVVIEQTKGMLMFVYGIDADAAFEILRTLSQQHNVKLRVIAQQILTDLTALSLSKAPPRRVAFGGLLLTAHHRIASADGRQRDGQSTPQA